MTEADWLACEDPEAMLKYLTGKASDRKFRLFATAACRRVEDVVSHPAVSGAIALAEAAAESAIPAERLEAASTAAFAVWREFRRPNSARSAAGAAARAVGGDEDFTWVVADWVRVAAGHLAAEGAPRGARKAAKEALRAAAKDAESRAMAGLLRDLFGNPFRPVTFSPEWRTDTALALARRMYESRDFSAMPILADALQDAGCDDEDILNHCRDASATHVRGCWVVDVVLGKQ